MQVTTRGTRIAVSGHLVNILGFWEMVRAIHRQCTRPQGHIGRFVVNQPMVIGHESAGTVVEVGEGVQHLQVPHRLHIAHRLHQLSVTAAPAF